MAWALATIVASGLESSCAMLEAMCPISESLSRWIPSSRAGLSSGTGPVSGADAVNGAGLSMPCPLKGGVDGRLIRPRALHGRVGIEGEMGR